MSDLDRARVVALVDQVKAQLDDLVRAVREHGTQCEIPQVRACIGPDAFAALYGNPKVFALLCVALVELANQPEVNEP